MGEHQRLAGREIAEAVPACRCPTCGGPVSPVELLFDHDRGLVSRGDRDVRLSGFRMKLLRALAAARPAVARKDRLYDALYNNILDGGPDPKIIDVMVCQMRPLIERLDLAIETHWGRGYALVDLRAGEETSGVTGREMRLIEPRHHEQVRDLLGRGFGLQGIAAAVGLSYRSTRLLIERVRDQAGRGAA